MTISLDALLALDGAKMVRALKLVKRLQAIVAELAEMGIEASTVGNAVEPPPVVAPRQRAPVNPPCHCGDPGEVMVDGAWYCVEHDPKP